jgi:flagellar basal-body rod protein FlgF
MDGIVWATSAMAAAQTRLDIATANLANVSTDGFHKAVARGKLTASGVDIEAVTSSEPGALRRTGRAHDLAIVGSGSFVVRDARGLVAKTRDGHFERDRSGILRDDAGRALLGSRGPICMMHGAAIERDGRVMLGGRDVNRIVIGNGATIESGFLETADTNAIDEMVAVLESQRAFEGAEKVVSAIDATRQKTDNDVARVQ